MNSACKAFVIGIVGAESTGKSRLAAQLRDALAAEGQPVALVEEYLREFCDRHGRTPRRDEQQAIADEQTRRIAAAAEGHDIVVADTTALMIAVYSQWVFGDRSLYDSALSGHQRCDLTILTALDIPWQPDGLQRDGAHVREPVDALLRSALQGHGLAYAVVGGLGPARLAAAQAATERARGVPSSLAVATTPARWQWRCERCGDADCERHLLPRP
jgi:nicotinamide riboside kinase